MAPIQTIKDDQDQDEYQLDPLSMPQADQPTPLVPPIQVPASQNNDTPQNFVMQNPYKTNEPTATEEAAPEIKTKTAPPVFGSAMTGADATPVYAGPGAKQVTPGQPIPTTDAPAQNQIAKEKFEQQKSALEAIKIKAVDAQTAALDNPDPVQGHLAQVNAKATYAAADQAEMDLNNKNHLGTPANHPGLFGKVLHVLSMPGVEQGSKTAERTQDIQNIGEADKANNDVVENNLKQAQIDAAGAKEGPKPVAGEEGIVRDAKGNAVGQLLSDGTTRPISYSGLTKVQAPATPAKPTGIAPANAQGQIPTIADAPVAQQSVASQAAPASEPEKAQFSVGAPKTVNPDSAPVVQSDVDAERKRLQTLKGNDGKPLLSNEMIDNALAVASTKGDLKAQADELLKMAQQGNVEQLKQRDEQNKEARTAKTAEEKADRAQLVYARDGQGNLIVTNAFEAHRHPEYTEIDDQVDKTVRDKARAAAPLFNDVQTNVSSYTKAASDVNKSPLSKKDNADLHILLNKVGLFDAKLSLSEGGEIVLPGGSSVLEALSSQARSDAFKEMSPQAQALYRGYQKTLASVPAFIKALTNTGRSNKEVMDLELQQIPLPTSDPSNILDRLTDYQRNIDTGASDIPTNFTGIKSRQQIRDEIEGTNRQISPAAQNLINKYSQQH